MKTAIDAGARRSLTVALKQPRSRKQLKDDFTIYGHVETSFVDGLQTVILNYHNIHHALRIVEVLTSGEHDLGDLYTGCELSFLATNAIQQTEPAYIVTGRLPRPEAPPPVSMPRAICITGLEKGYNVTDVVKKVGYGPVEKVDPHEDHLFIHYFSHDQACQVLEHPAGMQVSTVTDKHDASLAADIIARMAYRGTSRAVSVSLETLAANGLTEENVASLFAVFGPLESLVKSESVSGKPCITAVFLNHADALKCMDSPVNSLNLTFAEDPSTHKLTSTVEPRRVVIENLPTHVPTPVIFDTICYDVGSRLPHNRSDIAYFNRPANSTTIIIDFYQSADASRFRQIFQVRADIVGAQMRIEGIANLDRFHQIAMRSGARRVVDLSLAVPLELNQLEDDLTVYGRMRVIFASPSRVLIAYDDIRSAVKAVSCLATGEHAFGDSYDGAEVCFFDSFDGPSTGSAVVRAGKEREESGRPKEPWRPRELAGYAAVESAISQPGKGVRR
ncbi:hypothetical protein BDZ89DRAFT_678443 [Hymenopellis radicata]|nr:hypothetical protein BDZ89DRAFT_678443 [Hymenopellis radicata]